MLWNNIVLVPYGILTDYWLNLNRLHTCVPIEKLKETKDVPRARAAAESRRGVAWRAMRCVRACVTWRAMHERECGLVLPLGLAKEEEGVQR